MRVMWILVHRRRNTFMAGFTIKLFLGYIVNGHDFLEKPEDFRKWMAAFIDGTKATLPFVHDRYQQAFVQT